MPPSQFGGESSIPLAALSMQSPNVVTVLKVRACTQSGEISTHLRRQGEKGIDLEVVDLARENVRRIPLRGGKEERRSERRGHVVSLTELPNGCVAVLTANKALDIYKVWSAGETAMLVTSCR